MIAAEVPASGPMTIVPLAAISTAPQEKPRKAVPVR